MNTKTEVPGGSDLDRIHALMAEVVSKSSKREDMCVYRGEPECYSVVSSGLFRQCPDSANEAFDIARVEKEMLAAAQQYTTLADEHEILTEIQHFGGATNLIDFTDDYLIALFFACSETDGRDGRLVLHWPEPAAVVRPRRTLNRIVSQKSVFVRSQRGFIVPDASEETVIVPADLKGSILAFLKRFHGISDITVYNDIHGFIRHQTPSRSRYVRAFRESPARPRRDTIHNLTRSLDGRVFGIKLVRMRHAYHQRGMAYKDGKGSSFLIIELPTTPDAGKDFRCELRAEQVVDLFTYAIEREEEVAARPETLYCQRGESHLYQGAIDGAIRDFDEALDRDAEMSEAYHGRGNAFSQQGDADRAMADLDRAVSLNPTLAAAFIDRGNSHLEGGSLEEATRDFDQAIAVMRMGAYRGPIGVGDGHYYRAVAQCARQVWGEAKRDLEAARDEGVLVASSFRAICGGIPGFEADHDLRLPSDVATMLYVL